MTDGSIAPPTQESVGDTAENACRGLLLVDILAAQWGWFSGPEGKAVWARFRRLIMCSPVLPAADPATNPASGDASLNPAAIAL